MKRPSRLVRAVDALSQLANVVLLNGDANESISGRAWREPWPRVRRVIDALIFWEVGHCKEAYLEDLRRARKFVDEHDATQA